MGDSVALNADACQGRSICAFGDAVGLELASVTVESQTRMTSKVKGQAFLRQ